MRKPIAAIILVASVLALLWVSSAWESGSSEARADLVGEEVIASPSPTPTTEQVQARPVPLADLPTSPTAPASFDARPPGTPRKLNIPALGVDVAVVDVALEQDGSMEIPGATEAGWYQPGPKPGSSFGSAVIAAHIDYAGQRGAFFDLPKLQVGDIIGVTDEAGSVQGYVVSERFQVYKDDLPIDELFRASGDPTLTLITCGGAFDAGDRRYQDNIVVRAVPV